MKTMLNVLCGVLLAMMTFSGYSVAAAPEPGWTTKCDVMRVIDGDTLVVQVQRTLHVRLVDCWCAEVHETGVDGEKAKGLKAKAYMERLALRKEATLSVPTNASEDVSATFTLGRVLGRVWVDGDLNDLSTQMVAAKLATKAKTPKGYWGRN